MSFANPQEGTLEARLVAEVNRLIPWMRETRANRGRTLFGASGANVDQYEPLAHALAQIAQAGNTEEAPQSEIGWRHPMPLLIRHMVDDLRTVYHEAIAAQPGPGAPNHAALNDWIFKDTVLGEVLTKLADHLTAANTPMAHLVRGFMIPEGYYQGGSAFPATAHFGNDDKK